MRELKNRLLYGGLSREEYLNVEPLLMRENAHYMRIFSMIVAVLFTALCVYGFLGHSNGNLAVYASAAVSMILIFVINEMLIRSKKDNHGTESILICLFLAVVYMESFAVTLAHTDLPAVTYVGVLLVLPLLFVERPYRIILIQIASSIIFCILVLQVKELRIVSIDIWDTVVFLIPSIASILLIIPLRVGAWKESYDLDYLSEHDQLTEVMNRNAYEREMDRLTDGMADPAQGDLSFVLADVNGLQELNNTKGHEAGDIILQTVAAGIKDSFGEEAVYRVSGIEFVAICRGQSTETIGEVIHHLEENFADLSCPIFFSMAGTNDDPEADPRAIVKIAAKRMFDAKSAYYRRSSVDRRKR